MAKLLVWSGYFFLEKAAIIVTFQVSKVFRGDV